MLSPVSFTSLPGITGPLSGVSGPQGPAATGFGDLLSKTWDETQALTSQSRSTIETSLISEDLSMVETFTTMREADIALRLMLQVRNKLVDAYQELQQMRF